MAQTLRFFHEAHDVERTISTQARHFTSAISHRIQLDAHPGKTYAGDVGFIVIC